MFTLTPYTQIIGTTAITKILLPPKFFLDHFGTPQTDDNYKVSGQYIFTNEKGELFVIYDWKATTLYHGENSGVSTPEKFWKSYKLEDFLIGGRHNSNPKDFIKWLVDEYLNFLDTEQNRNGNINVFWP